MKNSDFILETTIDTEICDRLLYLYNLCTPLRGVTQRGVELDVKDSYDVSLPPKNILFYVNEIFNMVKRWNELWPSYRLGEYDIIEPINIQYYPPGGGFKKWHTELGTFPSTRTLVFMTYLNTVENGGTEFRHYNKKVEAVKGKTILWPAGITHFHRGVVSELQEKYIITGWISLVDEENIC